MNETDFISEDDSQTFDKWLKYQALDPSRLSSEELALWRSMFDETRERAAQRRKLA